MGAIASAAASMLSSSIPTSPILATPCDCSDWASSTKATNIKVARKVTLQGRTIELRYGKIDGMQRGWARMVNPKASDDLYLDGCVLK